MDYNWTNSGGGDFSDPDNWTDSKGKNPSGPPGAGDTALISDNVTIGVSGQAVASLEALNGATLDGDFSATDKLDGGTAPLILEGGTFTAGVLGTCTIEGADVSAQGVDTFGTINTLSSGKLSIANTDLEVGSNTLEIDGGAFTTKALTVGGETQSNNTPGFGFLYVAGGTAKISGQATLADGSIDVGENSQGTLSGAGSLTFTQGLAILSANGANSLTIHAGGKTEIDGAASVDQKNGSDSNTGLVADGGTLVATGTLRLGVTLSGALNVVDGGSAQMHAIDAGTTTAASSGSVYVDGAQSSLTADSIAIGVTGIGTFDVLDAATAQCTTLVFGSGTGSFGEGEISGQGSALTVTGTITIGEKGSGSLAVEDNAVLDPATIVIAGPGSPTGGDTDPTTGFHTQHISTLAIGAGADATSGDLIVGEIGYARLTVAQGMLTTKGQAVVAQQQGSEGQVAINGGNWTIQDGLTVGAAGKALVNIGADGEIVAQSALTVGGQESGKGQIVLGDGTAGTGPGTLGVSGALTLGAAGSGTLVSDESRVVVAGGHIVLGEAQSGKGVLTLNSGSLAFAGTLIAGENGSGKVFFNQGATFKSGAATVILGDQFGATGALALDGKGTSVVITTLESGVKGKGSVTVKDGAQLSVRNADFATEANSNANGLTVGTAGDVIVSGNLTVGERGFGTLSVTGAGQVDVSTAVVIGEAAASIGSATISGTVTTNGKTTASELAYGTALVGDDGAGSLTISGGGAVVAVAGGAGLVEIAAGQGSTGKLALSGTGSLLKGTMLVVGGTESAAGGSATVAISTGAKASFEHATLWAGEKMALKGGTLALGGTLSGTGGISIGSGSKLVLDGADHSAGITFAAGNQSAVLELAKASLLGIVVKGFAAGDSIRLDNLDSAAKFTVKPSGANTIVSFSDHGVAEGSLTLAGAFKANGLALTNGVLTVVTQTDGAMHAAHDDAFHFDAPAPSAAVESGAPLLSDILHSFATVPVHAEVASAFEPALLHLPHHDADLLL
ncbi:MAG TPA: hypothetical protein VGG10_20735 [Rhizomicrobium sp.]